MTISSIETLSGLVGYWPADELTGTTVNDVTATPADGAISGAGAVLAPWNSPGGVGAVGLRPTTATLASTAALTVSHTSKLNVGDNFSVGMFFRRRAAVEGSLYARGSACALNLDETGLLTFTVGATEVATSSVLIDDYLHWHFVVVTKSGSTTTLYVDGADVTVSGTNAACSDTGLAVDWFSAGVGLQPVVAAHMFLASRAISSAEQLAIYRAANMLPDKANPRSLRNFRLGFSCESTDGVVLPTFYSSPEAIAAAASRNHSTYMREFFAWKQLEPTQGVIDWSPMDRVIDAHQSNGLGVAGVFYNYSPSWALPAGSPELGTVPGSATKGISVAAADSNATNGGKGNGAYSTWRDRHIAFVVAAVHRYKDRIFEWELGNESHTALFGGPAASAPLFVDWYNRCRTAVLAELGADSWKHQIALGGLCRWRSEAGTTEADSYLGEEFLRAILDLGIHAFDRAALHPYLSTNGDPAVHTVNGLNLDGVLALRDVLMEYGRTPTIEIGEMGWLTEDTTVAAASDGVTLGLGTNITVEDAALLPYGTGGTVYIQTTTLGYQAVTYTGKTGNTLTGCTGGSGVISTGGLVSGSSAQPIPEATAARYLSECIALVRDCMSAFCGSFFYHTISGNYGGAGYLMAYRDLDLLSPKPMVGNFKKVAALHDPRQARPVLTPLIGAPIATSGDPSMGAVNLYDAAAGAIAANLPPLARLAPGARLIVGKSDGTANTVTLSCNGSDAFLDGSTSVALTAGMQREIQAIEVSDVKVWAFLGPSPQSVADNGDGTATI